MGLDGAVIAALSTVTCLKVPFSDGLGGYKQINFKRLQQTIQPATSTLCECW